MTARRAPRAKRPHTPRPRTAPVAADSSARAFTWAIAALAGAGIALSAWLTYLQYSSASTLFCLTGSGCDTVRSSPYAYVFGIPMSIIGIVGYSLILAAVLLPLSASFRRLSLYSLTLAGVAYSVYLTYLEFFVIRALCSYCLVSAGLMAALFILVLLSWRPHFKGGRLATVSGVVLAVVLFGSALAQSKQTTPLPDDDFRVQLARHLTDTGAVMYGAYWCSACKQQKDWFGGAFEEINYVECDPQGRGANPRLCQQKGVRGYPTWEINGEMYEGAIPLDDLAELSGYQPPP